MPQTGSPDFEDLRREYFREWAPLEVDDRTLGPDDLSRSLV